MKVKNSIYHKKKNPELTLCRGKDEIELCNERYEVRVISC